MSAIIIKNLSKEYKISNYNFFSTISERLSSFVGKRKFDRNEKNKFFALKKINLKIEKGSIFGLIGPNGAGKTTLLKIISKIVFPSNGFVQTKGRVSSLLEVGTGFHPELSGRENIFLNGSILGMKKWEIEKKIEEIIDFSGVNKFIDMPVKKYSSGMYVRLAFSVAAHLDSDILLVDEVLSVGDEEFQKKCVGKINSISTQQGKTVLLVSHDMGAVSRLCQDCALIENGCLTMTGATDRVIDYYLSDNRLGTSDSHIAHRHIKGNGNVFIKKAETRDEQENPKTTFFIKEPINIRFSIKVKNNQIKQLHFFLLIQDSCGKIIVSSFQKDSHSFFDAKNLKNVKVKISPNLFLPGKYFISAGIFVEKEMIEDWVEGLASFQIIKKNKDNSMFDNRLGILSDVYKWERE